MNSSSTMRYCLLPILVLSIALFTTAHLTAQTLSGVSGTVTDQSGAVVPGARVTATNDATGVVSSAVTNSAGLYIITDLIAGTYTVKVEKAGFETWSLKGMVVEAGGKRSSADASLKPGSVTAAVEVQASGISLETEQPELGTIIEHEGLEEVTMQMGGAAGGNTNRGRRID